MKYAIAISLAYLALGVVIVLFLWWASKRRRK